MPYVEIKRRESFSSEKIAVEHYFWRRGRKIEEIPMEKWAKLSVGIVNKNGIVTEISVSLYNELVKWCEESLQGRYHIDKLFFREEGYFWVFLSDESDAFLFKLRWHDSDES